MVQTSAVWETTRVQVEVSVQDCLSEDSSLEVSNKYAASRIAPETWETWFHDWLELLQPDVPASIYELSLRLTDDTEIQVLNASYRHQDQPTDVLAFAALEVKCPQPQRQSLPVYLGDIVISVDTADRQAQQQGHTLQTELAWLATHGLLHLLGWDHPNEDSLIEMLNQQAILMKTVGLDISET
jgi:probable rRNA maturation factor